MIITMCGQEFLTYEEAEEHVTSRKCKICNEMTSDYPEHEKTYEEDDTFCINGIYIMKCLQTGCQKVFEITGNEFTFPDDKDELLYVRCPGCGAIYEVEDTLTI